MTNPNKYWQSLRYVTRYWLGWGVTLVLMIVWPPAMWFFAGEAGRREMLHELTYLVFHLVVLPVIVGLSVGLPSLHPKHGSGSRFLYVMAIGTLILCPLICWFVVYEHNNRLTVGTMPSYMLALPPQAEAVTLEDGKDRKDGMRAIWKERFIKEAPFKDDEKRRAWDEGLRKNWQEKKDRLKALLEKGPTNVMPWINDAATAIVAFALLVIVAVRIIAKIVAHGFGEDYPDPTLDAFTVFLALSWIPMRLYADWHGRYWRHWESDEGDPFTNAGISIFVVMIIVILGLALAQYPRFRAMFLQLLQDLTTAGKAIVAGITLLFGLMAVPGANRWLEAQIDSEPTRVIMMGLVAVMVALMAYVGYQLIDQLSRAHKKADAV